MTYLAFSFFVFFVSLFLGYGLFVSLFELTQVSKNVSNIFIEKTLYISGPVPSKPVLLKGQLERHIKRLIGIELLAFACWH